MLSFLAFSISRAWQSFWRNTAMSLAATATMTLMLLLLSGFWIVQAGMLAGLQFVEQKVQVVADLRDDAKPTDIAALQARVNQMPEVAEVIYVSKDEALKRFQDARKVQGEDDLTAYLGQNPLPASLEVRLRKADDFGVVTNVLRADPSVERVKDITNLADRVVTVTSFLRTAGVAVVLAEHGDEPCRDGDDDAHAPAPVRLLDRPGGDARRPPVRGAEGPGRGRPA